MWWLLLILLGVPCVCLYFWTRKPSNIERWFRSKEDKARERSWRRALRGEKPPPPSILK